MRQKKGRAREKREGREEDSTREKYVCRVTLQGLKVCTGSQYSDSHTMGPEVLKHVFRLHLSKNFTE